MSFLDRFKRKAPESPTQEAPPAAPQKPAEPTKKADPAAIKAAAQAVLASHKKDFPSETKKTDTRLAPPVIPPATAGKKSEGHEMQLELGDFLHRIPQSLLSQGPHDLHQNLSFKIDEMAERISRGLTTIPLVEIYKQLPSVFRTEMRDSEEAQIRFPWQKVMIMLNQSRGAQKGAPLTEAAARALSEKLTSARPPRNIVPIKGEPAGPTRLATESPAKPAGIPPPAVPPPNRAPATSIPGPALAAAPAGEKKQPLPAIDFTPFTATPSQDDDLLTREELVRARDHANRNLILIKGELERQLTNTKEERKAIAEERDRIAKELERAQREVRDKLEQVEFQKAVATKSSENLQKLQQERDALLRKGAAPAQGGAMALAAASSNEQAKRANETEIQGLQQKILTLESARETAKTELDQARCRCRTLEEQLASAELAKQESTRKIEEATAKLKAEYEAAARQRETEATASIQKIHEDLKTVEEARRRLSAELEQAKASKSEEWKSAEERLKQETARRIEETTANLQREFAAEKQQREAEAANALLKLQADLDATVATREKLSAELDQGRQALTESTKNIENRLRLENEKAIGIARANLQLEFDAAKQKREAEVAATFKQLQDQLKAANSVHARLTGELEQAKATRSETARAAENRLKEEHARELDHARTSLRKEFEAAKQKSDEDAAAALAAIQRQLQTATETHARLESDLQQAATARSEAEKAAAAGIEQHSAIAASEAAAQTREKLEAEKQAAIAALQTELNAAAETRARLTADLDQAHKDRADSVQALEQRLTAEHTRKIEEITTHLRGEFQAAQQQREVESGKALKELQDRLEATNAERLKLSAELEQNRHAVVASTKATEARFAEEAAHKLEATTKALRGEFEASLQKQKAAAATAIEAIQTQLKTVDEARGKLSNELAQTKAAQTEEWKVAEARLKEETTSNLRREFEAEKQKREAEVAANLKQLQDQLQAANATHARLSEDLDKSKLSLAETSRATEARLRQEHSKELENAKACLRGELEAVKRKNDEVAAAALAELTQKLQAATESQTRLSAELEKAEIARKETAKAAVARIERQSLLAAEDAATRARENFESEKQAAIAASIEALKPQLAAAAANHAKLTAELEQARKDNAESTKALAQRLSGEHARKIEEVTLRLQKEVATAQERRDTEAARALKQLQDQLKTNDAERAKLSAELERSRKAIVESTQATEVRISAEAAQKLQSATSSLRSEFDAALQTQRSVLEKLREESKAANDAREKLSGELELSRKAIVESTKAAEARVAEEAARKLQSTTAALRSEFDATLQTQKSALEKLREELNGTNAAREKLSAELEKTRAANVAAAQAAETRLSVETTRQTEEITKRLRQEFEQEKQQREKEVAASLAKLQEQFRAVSTARDKFATELESARAAMTALKAEHEKTLNDTVAKLRSEFSSTLQVRESEATKAGNLALQALKQSNEQQLAEATKAAAAREAEQAKQLAQLQARIEETNHAHAKIDADLRRSQDAHALLVKSAESAAKAQSSFESRAVEQLEADVETYRQRIKGFLKDRDAAKAATEAALAELKSASEQFSAERKGLLEEKSTLEKRSIETEQTATQRLGQIQKLEAEIARQANEHERALATRVSEHQSTLSALRKEKESEVAALTQARDSAVAATAEIEKHFKSVDRQSTERQAQIEKLHGELGRLKAEGDSRLAQIKKLEAEIANRSSEHEKAVAIHVAQHDANLIGLRKEKEAALASLASARDAVLAEKAQVEKQLHDAQGTIGERQNQIEKLQSEIANTQETVRAKETEIARLAAQHEERQTQIRQLEVATAQRSDEHQRALTAQLSQHEGALVAIKAAKEAAVASLSAARDHVVSAKAELEKRLSETERTAADRQMQIEKLHGDVAGAQARIREREQEIARLSSEHQKALVALGETHRISLATLVSDKEATLAEAIRQKDSEIAATVGLHGQEKQAHSATAKVLADTQATVRQLEGRIQRHEADLFATREAIEQKEKEIAKLTTDHHDQLCAHTHRHGQELAALNTARDTILAEREAVDSAKTQLAKQLAEVQRISDERVARIEELDGVVANARTIIRQRDETINRLTAEHQQAIATHTQRHERTLSAMATEKDATIAQLAADKAAIVAAQDDRIAAAAARHKEELSAAAIEKTNALAGLSTEMERAMASLKAERDRLAEIKAAADAHIGELVTQRDEARKDSSTVAQRLADISIETEKRILEAQSETAAIIAAREQATADLDAATEAHKAQSAVFARELKSATTQRDQAVNQLALVRANFEQKETQLTKDRASLQQTETELVQQHEREMTRLRRERDSVTQQRDALRARFERVVDEQRELLAGLNDDVPGAPAKSAATARGTQAKPMRDIEPRVEPSIIDIAEPEVVQHQTAREHAVGGLRIQPARPVPLTPPNVRLL